MEDQVLCWIVVVSTLTRAYLLLTDVGFGLFLNGGAETHLQRLSGLAYETPNNSNPPMSIWLFR